MNIKNSVYESLTPRQRVIATIEAEARGDEQEAQRLLATCPKKTYTQADSAYTDMMLHLVAMSIAIETDVRGNVIGALIAVIMEHDDALQVFLQNIANIRAAWHETLEAQGIAPDVMRKFSAPLEHEGIKFVEGMLPEAQPEAVAVIREGIRSTAF